MKKPKVSPGVSKGTKGFSSREIRVAIADFMQLTLGAALAIVTFNLFMAPLQIAPGGVSGMSLLINNFTGFPEGLIMLVLNIPILILGYYTLGRRHFLLRTAYVVLLYNLGVDIFDRYLPDGITEDPLLVSLFGGVVGGIGSGLLFRGGGTAAGTSVISRVIQLRTGLPVSQLYLFIDGGIILLEALVFGWDKALYAIIMLFVWGLVTDYVLEGPSVVRTATIVTDAPAPIAQTILRDLGIGVTAWTGKGMYSGDERTVLFCTVNRPDVRALQLTVERIDPNAFIVIGQAHQRRGGVLKAGTKSLAHQGQAE